MRRLLACYAFVVASLGGCVVVDIVEEDAEIQACALRRDPHACAVGLMQPGECVTLLSGEECFPFVSRWDAATAFAQAECGAGDPWYCVPDIVHAYCRVKYECADPVQDILTYERCLWHVEESCWDLVR
jgi:hypothetical protein